MGFSKIKMTAGRALVAALIAAGALWCAQFAVRPQGAASRVFFEQGRDLFGDFRMPRVCAEYGYANDRQPRHDSCYPALGSALVKPFPFEAGGWFTGLGVVLWSAAFLALAGARKGVAPLAAALLSSLMLHAVERGNPVVYAAAGACLFVAWHDAESRWKRGAALLALAAAAALKVVPAALGLLLVARGRRTDDGGWFRRDVLRDGVLLAALGAALFLVPFVWFGGVDGFRQWLDNAAGNAAHYAHTGAWGFVALGRLARSLLHLDVTQPWPGLGAERLANAALGLFCLGLAVRALWTRRSVGTTDPTGAWPVGRRADVLMLLTGALLLVPGNMHFYAGLYLLPVFALRLREGLSAWEAACWFLLLCPVQVPMGGGSLNRPLANLAFMALLAGAAWRGRSPAAASRPVL